MLTRIAAALALATVVFSAAAQDAAPPTSSFFEEAKITVNERARADGYIRVRVVPENGAAHEGTLAIHKRMSENDIAKGIANALAPTLGPDYKVDRDAGEHVKIKKARKDAANFSVEVAFTAPGFSVILDN
ncbi:MAG TPA: hypothetical protein VFO94_17865 [Gammaproteobacteria bacterium]|nr:hypothetical protein [Gammaproteobacteria bacterium]